jgi:hypothetical protein
MNKRPNTNYISPTDLTNIINSKVPNKVTREPQFVIYEPNKQNPNMDSLVIMLNWKFQI